MDDKLIKQFIESLESKDINANILKDNNYNNDQKFVLFRALIKSHSIENISDPNISADEMEDILDNEISMIKELRQENNINPDDYTLKQLYELNNALKQGFNVELYKNPEFSADQMYIAKTFQQYHPKYSLSGLNELEPSMSKNEMLEIRKNSIDNQLFDESLLNKVGDGDSLTKSQIFYERVFQDIEKSNYSQEEKDYLKLMAEKDKQRLVTMPDEFFNQDLDFLLDVHFPIEHMIYDYRTEQAFYEKTIQDIEKSSYSSEEKDYLKFRASFDRQDQYSLFDEDNFNISQIIDEYKTDPRLREEHKAVMLESKIGISTNEEVLKHYEKISPELVDQARRDGGIDVPGPGGGQWNLKDEDPEYLAQLFAKATGEKIPEFNQVNVEHSQDQSIIKRR